MHHTFALASSLASLALVSAIYFCNIKARPGSWLKSDLLAMILLSLLTGLFPMACAATLVALWGLLFGGLSLAAVASAGIDLVSIAAVIASALLFRALVRATYSRYDPQNVTPFNPRPQGPSRPLHSMQKAA